MSRVCSHNEWDPLEEIIVGDCFNFNLPEPELSFNSHFHDNIYSYIHYNYKNKQGKAVINNQYLEETNEDLDAFSRTLEEMGVTVKRPQSLDKILEFQTPNWKSASSSPYSVRDQILIIGEEIIETPPILRCRYFENDLLKQTLYEYFADGAKWCSAPRPMMLDRSFDLSYISKQNVDTNNHYQQAVSEFDVGFEIMFDAAQILRFGRDLLMNVANENHRMGMDWLQRHLGDEYKIHPVHMTDDHIDSVVMPLRHGVLLLRNQKIYDLLPEPLKKWKIIYAPDIDENIFPDYGAEDLMLASKFIDINVLSVDEKRVVVNSAYTKLIDTLEKHDFTPIPVQLRHRRLFSGGFHCVTLDVRRRGSLESYF